mgnify:CR=1 FL=1
MPDLKIPSFEQGRIYKRRAIHDEFGGIRQTGISPSRVAHAVFIFTGKTGEQYGYQDEWDDSGQVFTYTGEGTTGDMKMDGGNRAIQEHVAEGRALHLFEAIPEGEMTGLPKGVPRGGFCRYVGEMQCVGVIEALGPDKGGNQRRVYKFQLVRVGGSSLGAEPAQEASEAGQGSASGPPHPPPLAELRKKAQEAARPPKKQASDAKRTLYERSQDVVTYALARAAGKCECCDGAAPFLRKDGSPYLEVHHVDRVSDGGLDAPHKVAAICPTCHRRIHYGSDGQQVNEALRAKVLQLEAALG